MAARRLRPVAPDEKPPTPPTVHEAARMSHRDLLVALRDKIAKDVDEGVPARDLASLSRRLLEIAKEIDSIDAADEGDDIGHAAATPDEKWSAR